ncbi:hypothetical protein DIPPA_09624 [Diplonema papillatum]|nr:hypothetical protein DIPPA_09624 [Diplonema papillatum]
MMNNSGGGDGFANVFVAPSAEQQRSVALSVNENADPNCAHHAAALKRLSDDAETRTLFLRKSVTLPVLNGRLDLDT